MNEKPASYKQWLKDHQYLYQNLDLTEVSLNELQQDKDL